MKDYPFLGSIILIVIFIFASVLLFPGQLLAIGAGYAYMYVYRNVQYALLIGTLTTWVGASIGANVAMLLGRYVFKDYARYLSRKYPVIKAID